MTFGSTSEIYLAYTHGVRIMAQFRASPNSNLPLGSSEHASKGHESHKYATKPGERKPSTKSTWAYAGSWLDGTDTQLWLTAAWIPHSSPLTPSLRVFQPSRIGTDAAPSPTAAALACTPSNCIGIRSCIISRESWYLRPSPDELGPSPFCGGH